MTAPTPAAALRRPMQDEDWWRGWMYLVACLYAAETDACATPRRCVVCHRDWLDVESAALALDLVEAEAISGRRTDGATTARREGVGWA